MKKLLVFLLVLIIVFGGIYVFLLREPETTELSNLYDEHRLIYEGDLQDTSASKVISRQVYLSYDFLKEHIDDDLFYDENESTVIITNDKAVRRYKVGEPYGTVNDVNIDLRAPVNHIDGVLMLPIEAFVYDYDIDVKYNSEEDLITIDRTDVEHLTGTVLNGEVPLREEDSSNSPIIKSLSKGEELYVYGETEKFYKVREKEGKAGYISKKDFELSYRFESFTKPIEKDDAEEAKEKINLVWDYTSVRTENGNNVERLVGVNVISPTWFSLIEDFSIEDRSNKDYVRKANSYGMDVWAMFDNSFQGELTENALKSSKERQKIISEVFKLAERTGVQGINIDFENLTLETRDNFTQFVKELYPIFKEAGMVVSVDVTPRIFAEVEKEPYDRKALADSVDYVMLMAYDQHWASSPKAGSVAEYSWVENNMNVLFRSIPMEKFVLGMPLYTRIWFDIGGNITSQSVSMELANEYIRDNNIDMEWDYDIKQYVGKKNIGNTLVSIWLEDSESIAKKTSLATKYQLAGVGSWRKGFETPDVWDSINENLQ